MMVVEAKMESSGTRDQHFSPPSPFARPRPRLVSLSTAYLVHLDPCRVPFASSRL